MTANCVVRRSSRSNKGQHSKLERKRKLDVVDDDEGETRCLCGDNEDDGGFMIQCETCKKWQHGECMGYENPEVVQETYACEMCQPDLYKDVPAKEDGVEQEGKSQEKTRKKKLTREKPVAVCISKRTQLTRKKSTKRKTPPSDDASEDNSEFSVDEEEVPKPKKPNLTPQSPKKKARTASVAKSPTPAKSSPQEIKKKPPPINTARRISHSSPQQRRSSTSLTPSTPHQPLAPTPLATKFADLADQKRVPAARIFAKIFEPLEPTKSESLGLAIEHALYTAFATAEHGYGEQYKSKFRSISFNLKDAKNSALRERVLSGELLPEQLVQLSSEEMANQELRAQAEKIREEGVAQSVIKVQTGPRIRRTHKGEEIVGDEILTCDTHGDQVVTHIDRRCSGHWVRIENG